MKTVVYPISVLVFFSFIIFIILATTRKVGLEMSTYYNVEMSLDNIDTYNVWKDGQEFFISASGSKDISNSNLKKVETTNNLKEENLFNESVFFILRFDSGKEDLNEFLHQLSKHELKQVMIASPNDSTLRNLRSLESNFYYAPSIKTLLKWSVFSRIYIEPIFNLNSDYIFIDEKVDSLLNPQLKEEIKRRKLPTCIFLDEALNCSA